EYEVDAYLWIGEPGQRGFEAVADILTGEVNPSGHLTDTYATQMESAPSTVNGSWHYQNWTNLEEVLSATSEFPDGFSWYTVQAEGIYVGYKYYETRYEDLVLGEGHADAVIGSSTGAAWDYAKEVRYPFGYGLSYTQFSQSLDSVEMMDDLIQVTVTVTNEGSVPGKSVVQVYAQTPYGEYEKENKVEKSAILLLDFGKTKELAPGESETLTLTCDKYLLASYDYVGAKGYYLSEGTYYLAIGEDVHAALNNILSVKGAKVEGDSEKVYSWEEAFDAETYKVAKATGMEVTNQFEDCDLNTWIPEGVTYLSRSDWEGTYPTEAIAIEATPEMIEELTGNYYEKAEDAPSVKDISLGNRQDIPLAALCGLDYEDQLWDSYLDQFTLDELGMVVSDVIGTGEIPEVGKPAISVGDGPDGVNMFFNAERYGDGREACCYPAEIVLASSFSKELLANRGDLLAEEAMYLSAPMIWMPGANLHRTPFGGRNFEYYSEDANMTYLCTIPTVTAMEEKGLHAGPKHFAANDQENGRMGISTFFNEQAFREGSLRGFEGAVVEAGCT
ncbi:MAG: fibronectin type III-like domain-contianing protein, partial [Blautia sp.]|nr:fibronectin type III-like domain-contianing protein [Blautia sp.]